MAQTQETPTGRPPVTARQYAVSSGHYLASLAGTRMLERGGNAIDAGVATGLCINVAQVDMTNLGGVAPIILYLAATREVLTISGLGWWPKAASIQWFTERGYTSFPPGVESSVVPSAVDAWLTGLADEQKRPPQACATGWKPPQAAAPATSPSAPVISMSLIDFMALPFAGRPNASCHRAAPVGSTPTPPPA